MVRWIVDNIATIIILAILILAVGAIIRNMIKNKKSGKSSCSCGSSCGGCPVGESCHKKK